METYVNNASTTLNGAITSTATSITVTSGTGFPSGPNFRILIDSEIILVTTGGSGSTVWTVTRGAEGTTAASHISGASVTHILTAGALDQIRSDLIGSGTFASRPSASKAGNIYLPTDSNYLSRDSGSAWVTWGPIYEVVPPPAISGFTWVNQGTATAVQATDNSIYMQQPSSTENLRVLVQAAPSTPYTITTGWLHGHPIANYAGVGLVLRNSTSGNMVFWQYFYNSAFQFDVRRMNSGTSYNADAFTGGSPVANPIFLRVNDDGTNRTYYFSVDNINYAQIFQELRTAFITADQVGFGLWSLSQVSRGKLIHWQQA